MTMDYPERTPEGKWVIYHADTGKRLVRWSIDARSLLETGEYTVFPPEGAEAGPAADAGAGGKTEQEGKEENRAPQHPLGVPLETMHSSEAPPAEPVKIPPARGGRKG